MNKEQSNEVPGMVDLATIVSLCKRRGFIYQNSEIYGGLGSVWDYGPLGVELKNNLKRLWWKSMVYERNDVEGLDAAILMNHDVWKTSGHVTGFKDLLVDCKSCKKRFRHDLIKSDVCPECKGELTEPKAFNLMFRTFVGSVESDANEIFLRPETAQGIFVNFKNILTSSRRKLPFGVAQIGKAFRNEITTGNFTFRSREFEQMELEYFTYPEESDKWFEYWVNERFNWYTTYGIKNANIRLRKHDKEELAHYAKSCYDVEFLFPMGWSELEGIAHRTDFDLKQHSAVSGKSLSYFDEERKQDIMPHVIEPSGGVDRAFLAFVLDAYREEKVRGEKRVVLGLNKFLAPVKVAVLPLLKKKPEIVAMAKAIYKDLSGNYKVVYDDTASIGKLYRRQDEIGTLYCVTVDVESLEDKKVTVRDRDTMEQKRIPVSDLKSYIDKLVR
ncbi:MAG: glycine--tRNA ligase [Candidatus Omnitrophica bacterium]|nr:glycine--tRNA ligase [Candidatus Omnitrophota bacterium]